MRAEPLSRASHLSLTVSFRLALTNLVPYPRIRFILQRRADHLSGEGLP